MNMLPGYHIKETLYSSGRSVVWRAIRESDGEAVILKQLASEYPEPGEISRFLFSYDVLRLLNHKHIVKAIGKLESTYKPTMVLEDTHSVDSLALLEKYELNQMPVPQFFEFAIQAADALSEIHHLNIIHKDLHPGNFLICEASNTLQITDFELASLLTRERAVLEPVEKLEGALPYIAPEQTGRMNRTLDYRADFYTLGATFYHWLTGEPPFGFVDKDDPVQVVNAQIARTQVPVSDIRADVPEMLSRIVDKLLCKSAEDRYQSAQGLSKDLKRCLRAINRQQTVPDFPLAMDDISDRFHVPQKLYGREDEVEILLSEFFSAAKGISKVLAIGGFSGIGKSALVHEVHKPIASYNGIFVFGKFDQFKRNTPYFAFKIALNGWLRQALSFPGKVFTELQQSILAALGSNARILIDFMPDFSLLLGDLPQVAVLESEETKARLHSVLVLFLKTITQRRPLVMFIDDLQWADRGTLDLLPLLVGQQGCKLLVIVAYRDNEVDSSHPLTRAFEEIEEHSEHHASVRHLMLDPLSVKDVSNLLRDALSRTSEDVKELAQLIEAKTAGNPFFIGEFLRELYFSGLLNFNLKKQCWVWLLPSIETLDITDNVVDLMLDKMNRLPKETQALIQLAACIGGRFDLDMLANVSNKSLEDIVVALWPALKQGVLLQDGGDWALGTMHQLNPSNLYYSNNDEQGIEVSPLASRCRFLHDRMMQAAYLSVALEDRQKSHLKIARILQQQSATNEFSTVDFAMVDHFNQAYSLIERESEIQQLVLLNLRAAKEAMSASVWQAAADYSSKGIRLLEHDAWERQYEVTRDLYKIRAECEYLEGNPEIAENDYQVLFKYLQDSFLKAEILSNRVTQNIGRGKWLQGLDYGFQALSILGYALPSEEKDIQAAYDSERRFFSTVDNAITRIEHLPFKADAKIELVLQLLVNVTICGWLVGNKKFSDLTVLKAINITLTHGRCSLTAVTLSMLAFNLRVNRHYEAAFSAADLAKKLAESDPHCWGVASCYNSIAYMVWYLRKPINEAIPLHERGALLGLENGEFARSLINRSNILTLRFAKGDRLSKLRASAHQVNEELARGAVFQSVPPAMDQACEALLSSAAVDDLLLESMNFQKNSRISETTHYFCVLVIRTLTCFWLGRSEDAWELIQEAYVKDPNGIQAGGCLEMDCWLVFNLIALEHTDHMDEGFLQWFYDYECQLNELSELCPDNFSHKDYLLKAVQAHHQKHPMEEVIALFQHAIEAAKRHGFIQYQALANELFAEYWMDEGYRLAAEPYVVEALYLYHLWGCKAKVDALKRRYADTLVVDASYMRSESDTSATVSIGSDVRQSLDLASVIKSAQIISKELHFDKVAKNVLQVIEECAGATRSALIESTDGLLRIIAYRAGKDNIVVPQEDFNADVNEVVPENLVSYVLRTKEMINLGDAIGERAFIDDPYIMLNQPRSVLCLPIQIGDGGRGVFYLENSLTIDAFTEERLDVIELLLAQAVISFANARLFSEISLLNVDLENKVQTRTEALAKTLKKLELANEDLNSFSYSVSHDLRSPLRSLKGFGQMLIDDYGDVFDSRGQDLLRRIVNNSIRMMDLIDGLLELSRIQRREITPVPIDLSKLVSELFTEMKERFPRQAVSCVYTEGCRVKADERMLYSAMENLIQNAWKYSSKCQESKIEFGVILPDQRTEKDDALIPVEVLADDTIYFVKDNGVGFDLDKADQLFTAFYRLHSEKQFPGTGIGLSTVKRIIEKHGGNIWCDASIGQGAAFYFTLPT